MKYVKKPIVIDAIKWDGSERSTKEILQFMNPNLTFNHKYVIEQDKFTDYNDIINRDGLTIHTLEGDIIASVGDYIIKGVKGEFYPCKPDIFIQTYDVVE